MLQEARRNCAERAIENVDFVLSNDTLSQVTGQFNYIQSFLVFQHIPVPRGEQLLHHLLELLAIGGVGVFHFTYSADPSTLRAIANVLRSWVPFSANVINVIKGQSWQTPQAQMNNYNLNRVMDIFTRHQVNQVQVQIMDQDGYRSVVLYVQKGL